MTCEHVHSCEICHDFICEDCTFGCEGPCGMTACRDCVEECATCSSLYCEDCLDPHIEDEHDDDGEGEDEDMNEEDFL